MQNLKLMPGTQSIDVWIAILEKEKDIIAYYVKIIFSLILY
ncbi:MAG: hypothetical protein ACP5M8_07200 [Caldisphaera sp.]|jgi:hypothetical protein|nr:hypothetical protein [Caldisphaera sp.]